MNANESKNLAQERLCSTLGADSVKAEATTTCWALGS